MTKAPVIMPCGENIGGKLMGEYNLFIGDWGDEDTQKLCNPRLSKTKQLEGKKQQSKD